jgi:UDP-glucose 4-epimerase
VTGGAGFIGSHLVEELVRDGHEVTVLDSLLTGSLDNLASVLSHVRFAQIDLSEASEELVKLLAATDCVFHLAAVPSVVGSVADPLASHANCGTATLVLLDAMKQAGARRIVFSSSCAVYGDQRELPWRSDMLPRPMSPYAADKLASEHYLEVYARLHGMHAASLRYFNVYGPRQPANSAYAAVIPNFARALHCGSQPIIYGDGSQTRDFVHVTDVVRCNLLAASHVGHGVFNVGSGQPVSICELFDVMAGLCDATQRPMFMPARAGEVLHSHAEVSATEAELGFRAKIGLREGLAELLLNA